MQFAKWRHNTVQSEVAANGLAYTNTVRFKERVACLLAHSICGMHAALDCFKAVADHLPPELTLDNLNFERGRTLRVFGTAAPEEVGKVQKINDALRNVQVKGQPLFGTVNAPNTQSRGQQMAWNFAAELKQGEGQ